MFLNEFEVVSSDYVKKLIASSTNKSCSSDPVPICIVKICIDELLPVITSINLCLANSCLPDTLKRALVVPNLKKLNAELKHKNFRPVSNHPFLSNLTEKVVAQQTVSRMSIHCLFLFFNLLTGKATALNCSFKNT